MEVNVLKESKDEIEVELDNITLAEILRVYLNKDSNVTMAVWRRKHSTEKPILLAKTKGKTPKKAINNAISNITKELDNFLIEFKNLK